MRCFLLHGYGGTRYSALQYAPLFWERGCDLLAYDARGHGESSAAFHTYGYYEKQDAVAAYEWLRSRSDLEPGQVGLAGVSYGAATSLQAVPLLPEAAFVLADSSYENLQTIVSKQGVDQFGNWTKLFVPTAFVFASQRADFDVHAVSPERPYRTPLYPFCSSILAPMATPLLPTQRKSTPTATRILRCCVLPTGERRTAVTFSPTMTLTNSMWMNF
ncbi:MAG: alpha/beta hydrolase [Anaerolineae bacterium]|nr:alpha/beta hydrolase [Anaerolineae bacterium]